MRHCSPTRHNLERLVATVALGIALCDLTSVGAQTLPQEPVEALRSILRAPCVDPAKRARGLQEQMQTLQGLGDLRRALVLSEWRDRDQDQRVAAVDRPNRLALARRFEQALRHVLWDGDEASCLVALNMLAEIGTTTHGVGGRHGIARGFGPDLAGLAQQGDAGIREAAARCLGQIDPEPEVAVSAFSILLSADNPSQRLAAADGLLSWIRTMAQMAGGGRHPDSPEVTRADFVKVAEAAVPLAARGLRAEQPEIRRRSVQAIGQAAMALHDWVLALDSAATIEDLENFQRRTEEERAALSSLFQALRDQGPALTHALVDADAEVRFRASRALDDLTIPREMVSQEIMRPKPRALVRPSNFIPASSSHRDLEGVTATVQALAVQLADTDIQVRRGALDTLESLGPDAAPATAALVAALADPDKFVRWAATRTLGRIGPVEEEAVVPALAQLLTDADLDVRLAAVVALERLGPAAQAVTPDLRRTIGSTDAELRAAAIRALGGIGGANAHAAVPELTAAVVDVDARVRQIAAQVLGRFGPPARDAVPALRQALADDSPDVQKAAGQALLNILRPGKE